MHLTGLPISRFLTGLLLLWCPILFGQDLHFSMAPMAPISLSPALAGVDEADIRVGASWRDQWQSVPVPYSTFSVFYDQKYGKPLLGNDQLAWGLVFQYDQAGDGRLSWTQLGFRTSYTRTVNDENAVTLGLGLDIGQRSFSPERLQFGDQYNGEFFDPGQSSLEGFQQTASAYWSGNAGLNWFFHPQRTRTKTWHGFSISHFNRPELHFLDQATVSLPMWLKAYLFGAIELNADWDAVFRTHHYWQGPYRELLLAGGAQIHLPFKDEIFTLGGTVGYRFGDAMIVGLQGEFREWKWGLSYDINTSAFQAATLNRGGIEIAVHYNILQVKPPDEFKSCPIF